MINTYTTVQNVMWSKMTGFGQNSTILKAYSFSFSCGILCFLSVLSYLVSDVLLQKKHPVSSPLCGLSTKVKTGEEEDGRDEEAGLI